MTPILVMSDASSAEDIGSTSPNEWGCGKHRLSQPSEDYAKVFESTKDALGAPTFVWVKAEPPFRSKTLVYGYKL